MLAHGQMQSPPLSDGIPDGALVGSDFISLQIQKISRSVCFSGVIFDKFDIISVRDKADILAVMFIGINKFQNSGNFPHLCLPQFSQRKLRVRQLILCEGVQDIALILGGIHRLLQQPAACGFLSLNPRIMACHNIIVAVLMRKFHQLVELHVTITVDTRIGCPAFLVDADKLLNDLFIEVVHHIDDAIGNPYFLRHHGRIFHILRRTAGMRTLSVNFSVGKQAHGRTHALISLLMHDVGRNRAVNASAHGNQRCLSGTILLFHIIHPFNLSKTGMPLRRGVKIK